MGFFSCFNKIFLIILNFIVFIFGTGIVILSSMVIHKSSVYKDMFIDNGMMSLPIVVLIIGLIITVLGFFGCCGAVRENPCMLYTYAAVVLCLFLAGVVIGILVLVYPHEAQTAIKQPISKAFEKYGDKDKSLNNVIDAFQHDLQCCGVDGPSDWEDKYSKDIPRSCCKVQSSECNPDNASDIFDKGCFNVLYHSVKKYSMVLGISCIVLATVEFLCICIACGLAKKRSQYV